MDRLSGSDAARRRLRLTALGVSAATLALLAVMLSAPRLGSWLHRSAPLHGQNLGQTGWPADFDLQDARGQERTVAQLRGRLALVTFGYTHCPDSCPATLARLAAVRRLLGIDARQVQVVFITIDPERDTAALLGPYVGAFDASFWALRGGAERTDAAARAFHAEYHVRREGREVSVEHTVDVFLVDRRGRIREVLPPYLNATQVADDVRTQLEAAG